MDVLRAYGPPIDAALRRWSRSYDVRIPRELVGAIILEESGGDPRWYVRENTGTIARGLMQVTEATALELGLVNPLLLHVPSVGIDYGVHYLARQAARYRGKLAHAVAAYNAGSARFTEHETFVNQPYVDRVVATYRRLAQAPAGFALAAIAGSLGLAWLLGGRGTGRGRRRAG